MFKPEYNSFIVIVELVDGSKAYAFLHDDGTYYEFSTFEPLSGDLEVIGHTDTVIAYCMEGGTVTDSSTFILHENVVEPDDVWVV